MVSVMLLHGWAFDASVWDDVVACLPPGLVVRRAERGYFDAEPADDWPAPPVLAVGHSLGALLALTSGRADGLLAINGFTRLTYAPDWPAGIAARPLARMASKFAEAPEAVVAQFLALHGAPPPPGRPPMASRLAQDLQLLRDADGRDALMQFGGPVRALAGRDDALVGVALAHASFGPDIVVHDGGHLLPLTAPAVCAAQIVSMAALLKEPAA